MTSSLFHNKLLCHSGGSGGLGLVVVVRLLGVVWQEARVVIFVKNVCGCNSFNVKGCAFVVFGSTTLFAIFSNLVHRCCGRLL